MSLTLKNNITMYIKLMNYFYIGLIILFLTIGIYYVRKYLKNYFDMMKNNFLENSEYNLETN